VIEPRESLDRNLFTTKFELARGLEAGEGVVVAGVSRRGGFTAQAFFPLESERFQGGSRKIESDSCGGIGGGHGESRVRFSLEGPVGDPNLHVFL